MERLKRTNLDAYLEKLNKALKSRNSVLQYKVVGQNDGYTIEIWKGDEMIDSLFSNLTLRNAYNVIRGMGQVITDGFPLDKP